MRQRRSRIVPLVFVLVAAGGFAGCDDDGGGEDKTVRTGASAIRPSATTSTTVEEASTSTSTAPSTSASTSARPARTAVRSSVPSAPIVSTTTTDPCTALSQDTIVVTNSARTALSFVRPDGSCHVPFLRDASHASWSPQRDRLAMLSNDAELSIVNRDGTGRRVLASKVTTFAWSWAGDRIAFVDHDDRSNPRLWTIEEDGTGKLLLVVYTTGHFPSTVTWSPDDALVAYSYVHQAIKGIWTVSSTKSGEEPRQIHPSGSEPSWGRDGRIVFVEYDYDRNRVFISNRDGSGAKQVGLPASVHPFWPMWSPDGSTILYTSIGAADIGIFTVAPSGAGNRRDLAAGIGVDWSAG